VTTPAFPELTEREREILGLMAEHRGNAEIARRLVLSEKTVRNHVSNIFQAPDPRPVRGNPQGVAPVWASKGM
jgi:FixJ family two-component response regulator